MTRWERSVPVYGVPVLNRGFWGLLIAVVIGLVLTVFREIVGLGITSGMSDPYAWGLWKTFNVMVLTGLGSGAFAVGIAAWVFNRTKLHSVMRVALLTSFLAYSSGLAMLGVDVGRPWNFYWVMLPWQWNLHSPLLEIAFCMSMYAVLPLFLENLPPVFEYVIYEFPHWRGIAEFCEKVLAKIYPFIIGLAYLLPIMHQSSLGALMLLGGNRVHALWQTPFLPLIYVWASGFLGYNCVVLCLLVAKIAWGREVDLEVLAEMNRITYWIVFTWTAFRFADILVRGKILLALIPSAYSLLFWTETLLIAGGGYFLYSKKGKSLQTMFLAHASCALGGMIYRFSPTTLAFRPRPGAFYFPSAIEVLICIGFIALMGLGYIVAVKKLAILPGTNADWVKMAKYEEQEKPGVRLTGYAPVEH
jgi:Ni/Fe-hydrogenase subunit HybB-like protein